MAKKLQAFTLIELMVVVAIIALLATLSVSNFSAAIRKTRNSQRVSDVQTVAKAMETCYDVMTGKYSGFERITDPSTPYSSTLESGAQENSFFSRGTLKCLNQDITPSTSTYDYNGYLINDNGRQTFSVCAKLEYVSGWEGTGNSVNSSPVYSSANGSWTITKDSTGCQKDASDSNVCYFCVTGQQ